MKMKRVKIEMVVYEDEPADSMDAAIEYMLQECGAIESDTVEETFEPTEEQAKEWGLNDEEGPNDQVDPA